MLLFFLLLILVTAAVANFQLHQWKRQRRMDMRAQKKSGKAGPKAKAKTGFDLDEIDWEGLAPDELDTAPPPPPPTPVARPKPAPVKAELPAPLTEVKSKVAARDEFLPLERALREQMSAAHRREALAHLLKANLHLPTPEPGEQHVVLDMDDGSYVPVATHPAAASIALGYLAAGMQQRRGEQLVRELRGGDVGLLVVARNPQKPSVARLWKILPEDL
ncbi:hypothetical protein N5C93_28865 [Pseudomonas nitroreducens]|uniref:hypothetical protein n=1 Tax=Pseudomonas nitroreducens TaxID=46680 RepID=UPI00244A3130|nr:hypothetical protein [Pseudomonas nitroreducens]MDG9853554.1 hypothetical protein [Pseudomonas nitroreducens]MDH1076852.1 hypothetical protein [Pseudomonas nitroreducens]